jgi:hypothetical protein
MKLFNWIIRNISLRDILNSILGYFIIAVSQFLWDLVKGNINDILSYKLSLPIYLIVLVSVFLLILNRLLLKRRIKHGRNQKLTYNTWKAYTDQNNPQWASYNEIPLDQSILKSISCELEPETDYIRFGFKILPKGSLIFQRGVLNDKGFMFHVGKASGETKIYTTIYSGFNQVNGDFDSGNYNGHSIRLKLDIKDKNIASFIVNGKTIQEIPIQAEARERVCLMAWGDGIEYNMYARNIIVEVIK